MGIEAGRQLLHYGLIEKIGEGGMGVVWKAIDTTLDREVALKILPDALTDAQRLARFDREARPLAAGEVLLRLGGEGTELARKHDIRVQYVAVAEYPEGYEDRLIDITPRGFRRLKLRALEIHDVVLAKLSRNSPRVRADVEYLVRKGVLDSRLLEERFEAELRPNLLNVKREMLTLVLWLAEFFGKEQH